MIVVDREPHRWFLLESDGVLYLDVACEQSFGTHMILIALTEAELARWRAEDRLFLDQLAYEIHSSAPARRGSQSPFTSRNLRVPPTELSAKADDLLRAENWA